MFDTIECEQVKCFGNELKFYINFKKKTTKSLA